MHFNTIRLPTPKFLNQNFLFISHSSHDYHMHLHQNLRTSQESVDRGK
jgi:hypothetical protein